MDTALRQNACARCGAPSDRPELSRSCHPFCLAAGGKVLSSFQSREAYAQEGRGKTRLLSNRTFFGTCEAKKRRPCWQRCRPTGQRLLRNTKYFLIALVPLTLDSKW